MQNESLLVSLKNPDWNELIVFDGMGHKGIGIQPCGQCILDASAAMVDQGVWMTWIFKAEPYRVTAIIGRTKNA